MIDKAQHIQINVINGALNFHNVLDSHLGAAGIFDNRHRTVQLVKVQVFVNLHALAGLDVVQWLELVVMGAAGSKAMDTLGRRILKNDFAPGFFINHFIKDLGLCLEECRRMQIVLPGIGLAEELYRSMQARGQGNLGTQALIDCLASLSGKHWQQHSS